MSIPPVCSKMKRNTSSSSWTQVGGTIYCTMIGSWKPLYQCCIVTEQRGRRAYCQKTLMFLSLRLPVIYNNHFNHQLFRQYPSLILVLHCASQALQLTPGSVALQVAG